MIGGRFRLKPWLSASRQWTAAALTVLLTACATQAPPALETSDWTRQQDGLRSLNEWQFRGRVNARYEDESHTPRILWRQRNRSYDIRLWGTFNAGNTRILGDPGGVSLETDGEVLTAATPEALILEHLGYELPVSHLEYWLRGLPAPRGEADLRFNERNQLRGIAQDGWSVSYTDPRQYGEVNLPGAVEVARSADDVRLRFVGLRWSIGGDRQ